MRIIAIIQGRMKSSRLPDKVLLDIGDRPMLQWVVERTRQAKTIHQVVVATTTDSSDDPVAEFCQSRDISFTRGSVHDVLDRYYQAAKRYRADVIVRITADCPLIDPELIDEAVNTLLDAKDRRSDLQLPTSNFQPPTSNLQSPLLDFVANRLPQPWWRTYPLGLDTEVFTFAALERAWREASEPHHREHVTPYFYEDIPAEELHFSSNPQPVAVSVSPRGFRVALLHHHVELGDHRWTVDTPEDLELVREIVVRLPNDRFSWLDVLALMEREPELMQINSQIPHKTHLDVDERPR